MMLLHAQLDRIARAPWLRRVWLHRLLFAIAVHFDALIEWCVLAMYARYPRQAPPDALVVLGRERGIRRGLAEPDDAYAARLVQWLPDRKIKGSPFALMSQIVGYVYKHRVRVRVVNEAGAWFTRNATREVEGRHEWHHAAPSNWDWDGEGGAQFSRYWVILMLPDTIWPSDGTWGDSGKWGDTGVWGYGDMTREQAITLRDLIRDWNPPHAMCAGVIATWDPDDFDPTEVVRYVLDVGGAGEADFGDVLAFDDADPFTITGWFNAGTQINTDPAIVGKRQDAPADHPRYRVHLVTADSNKLRFDITDASNDSLTVTSTAGVADGEWHHFAVTYHGDGATAAMWVDGVPQDAASGGVADTLINVGADFQIGNDGSSDSQFVGMIDDVAVFDRVLTTAEIAETRAERDALDTLTCFASCVGYWPARVGETALVDVTAFGNDGTLTGAEIVLVPIVLPVGTWYRAGKSDGKGNYIVARHLSLRFHGSA
jgi:hypothetical protein